MAHGKPVRDEGREAGRDGGSFFDLYPVSVLTTSSLDQLGEVEPQSRFDVRRFRMNVIVDTRARGFVENEWVGHTLAIGEDVQLSVALPDPRCVMPSLAQEDLPRDSKILKALVRHNRIDVAGALYPCAGVYAVAEATGTIRKDDHVTASWSGVRELRPPQRGGAYAAGAPPEVSAWVERQCLLWCSR